MMENYRSFYEEVGEKYPEEDLVYRSLRGRLRRRFVSEWLLSGSGRFLDVGCNRGMYLHSYENGPKMGVDLSFAVLQRAREKGEFPLVVADAQRLSCLRPGSFDLVLCSEVLEHVSTPADVIWGIQAVLAPGGRALLTTPNYRSRKPEWVETGLLKTYGIRGVHGERYFHTAFRPEELAAMGEEAGLTVVERGTLEKEIKYAAKLPALLFIVSRFLNRRMLRSPAWSRLNQEMLDRLTVWIHQILRMWRLDGFLNRLVSEGVRSFVILEKPAL